MPERWINVIPSRWQAGDKVRMTDSPFSGVLLCCEWTPPLPGLDTGKQVKIFRYLQDPRQWPGWPARYVAACPLGVFANEPDIEGTPPWAFPAATAWRDAGGLVVSPAYHNEAVRPAGDNSYDCLSWHCYAGDFTNRTNVLSRAKGRPVYGTEYARPGEQRRCLADLAGIPEPVAVFAWDWQEYGGDTRYTVRGMTFDPPDVVKGAAMAEPTLLTEANNSNLCGPLAVAEWFDGYGHQVSPLDLYREAHRLDYVPPGDVMSFDQLQACVISASALTGARIELFNGNGYVWDLNTLDQVVRDGWCVIAGTLESDIHPGENYGHFFAVYGIQGDAFKVKDELHHMDALIPVTVLHKATVDNWTGPNGQNALAFKILS